MTDQARGEVEQDLLSTVWDPQAAKRCIVCNRPSEGRAICGDKECAMELANG